MEDQNSNNISSEKSERNDTPKRIAIAVLVLLLVVVGVGLIFKFMESQELQEKNRLTQLELDQTYNQLDSMSNELDTRILKIAQLGGEIDTLLQIKTQLEKEKKTIRNWANQEISNLKDKVSGYKELLVAQDNEIERLKILNDSLYSENTGLKEEANVLNASIQDLNKSKSSLEEKVAMASKLKIDRLSILAVSSSDKTRESPFKNRHIDHLSIEFDVLENRVAAIEGKNILVKITDPDNNVLFDVAAGSGTFVFEGRESFYTAKKDILFDRNTQTLTFKYAKGSDYNLGKYLLEVFTEDYKMGTGSFIVK